METHEQACVFLLCKDHRSVEPENKASCALYGVPMHTSYSASVSGWALLTSHLSPITLHSCILYTPSPCTSPSHVQEGYPSEDLKTFLTSRVCVLCYVVHVNLRMVADLLQLLVVVPPSLYCLTTYFLLNDTL